MALTPLPTAPTTSDPANFATRADAFVAALATMVSEINSGKVDLSGGTVTGALTLTAASPQLTLGVLNTTSGAILSYGSSSGSQTWKPPAAAGSGVVITFPGATCTLNDANALTGTTLASGVTASSLTSVGTLTGLVLGGNVTESGGARAITVTGAISGGAISGTTLNLTSFFTPGGTTPGAQIQIGERTTSVTTAKQIGTFNSGQISGLFIVAGDDGTNYFVDIVAAADGGTPNATSLTAAANPAARTYTTPGAGALKVAMASGTYTVRALPITFKNN